MSQERTPARNILALSRTRSKQTNTDEEAATSYMPTDIDLAVWLPDEGDQEKKTAGTEVGSTDTGGRRRRHDCETVPKRLVGTVREPVRRKRISLYLEDDVLTKIFHVSLERHEQLSAATHRLIVEALKARGL